jgi:hypothetical protein
MANTDILREWYSRVWEQGDISAIDELFVPDTLAKGIVPDMELGVDELKFLVATIQEMITPPKVRIDKLVEQGDWVAGFMTLHVTSREVVWLFLEQLRLEFVPILHRLQG